MRILFDDKSKIIRSVWGGLKKYDNCVVFYFLVLV